MTLYLLPYLHYIYLVKFYTFNFKQEILEQIVERQLDMVKNKWSSIKFYLIIYNNLEFNSRTIVVTK
jgi:hypothetical protein